MNRIILFAGIAFFLWLGRSIFIPLLVATFLWYLINAIAAYYRMAMPCDSDTARQKHKICSIIFNCLSQILALATLIGFGYLFITQIRPMFSELVAALPGIQNKLIGLGNYLSQSLGFTLDTNMLPNITKIATSIGTSAAGLVTSLGMVLVYILFMFVEQSTFDKKFNRLCPNKKQSKKIRYIVDSIDENMKKYLFVKTLISAATGISSYLWLSFIGLEFAGVWAFIIFVANYIPTIGSIFASSLPILFSLAGAPSLHEPVLVTIGLVFFQVLFGNIIEPRLTGKTLNLSTLAILINLVFWGMIWGIAGMFFSVPILVATFIITAQFDSTRWIAILLSANGNIPDKRED